MEHHQEAPSEDPLPISFPSLPAPAHAFSLPFCSATKLRARIMQEGPFGGAEEGKVVIYCSLSWQLLPIRIQLVLCYLSDKNARGVGKLCACFSWVRNAP